MLLVLVVPLGLFTEKIEQGFDLTFIAWITEDEGRSIHTANSGEWSFELSYILSTLRSHATLGQIMLLVLSSVTTAFVSHIYYFVQSYNEINNLLK